MNIEREIFEICEKVVKNGSNFGVNCDGIYCDDCPLCGKNREDGEGCVDNDEETVKIAKEYIDKNKVYCKLNK